MLSSVAPMVKGSVILHAAALAGSAAAPAYWAWALAALAANHAMLTAAGMSPRSRLLGPNIVRLTGAARVRGEVALTFDDGPDAVGTPMVLDILDRHGASASFFCIGSRAARDPGLVREIAARGHFVENHTFHHPNGFAFRGPSGLTAEIRRAQGVLTEATGRQPVFFRAPMGFRGPFLEPVLWRIGLSLVSWTRRGLDGRPADPGLVLARLTRGLAAGDVLALHDGGPSGGQAAVQTLPRLLSVIAGKGLRAVSLTHALAPQLATETDDARAMLPA